MSLPPKHKPSSVPRHGSQKGSRPSAQQKSPDNKQRIESTTATPAEIEEIRKQAKIAPLKIALTFDDGPTNMTGTLLSILNKKKVQATFFLVGEVVATKKKDAVVYRIRDEGHYIGSHSYEHAKEIRELTDEQIVNDCINKSKQILKPYGLKNIFRLPRGDGAVNNPSYVKTNEARLKYDRQRNFIKKALADAGFQHVLWHADTEDYLANHEINKDKYNEKLNKELRKRTILKGLNDLKDLKIYNGIFLFHDMPHTVRNLEYYIDVLHGLGHTIVPLDQFLDYVIDDIDKKMIPRIRK